MRIVVPIDPLSSALFDKTIEDDIMPWAFRDPEGVDVDDGNSNITNAIQEWLETLGPVPIKACRPLTVFLDFMGARTWKERGFCENDTVKR